jgi:hypothetical protein
VRVALHVGEHDPGVTDEVAPLGRPDTEKVTDCAVPDASVALIVFVTDEARTTLLAPPVDRLKSNAEGLETVTATGDEVVVLFDVSRATAVRV